MYEGAAAEDVPGLGKELVAALADQGSGNAFVLAAMAHLNFVMIHPFRDGNGRMARVLHTLVLTRAGLSAPDLSSIEEWLGRHTDDHYQVLATTSDGAWSPEHDAHLWIKFCLRAHHLQAQTVQQRLARAAAVAERTATCHFKRLADVGLLRPVGETKGRYYVAGEGLFGVVAVRRDRDDLVDPYEGFRGALYA